MIPASCVLLLALGYDASRAHTLIVPDQYATIQSAIFASATSDTVLVRSGIYPENIDFLHKAIVVSGIDGAEATIIDASSSASSVVYMVDVPETGELRGFTLTGGTGRALPFSSLRIGGGLCVIDSLNLAGAGPLISDNRIIDNSADGGGGVAIRGSARLVANEIMGNEAESEGGVSVNGVLSPNVNPILISENAISGNRITGSGGLGGGLYISGHRRVVLSRNVVACNEGRKGAAIYAQSTALGLTIEGNTFFANQSWDGNGTLVLRYLQQPFGPIDMRANVVVFNFGGGIRCVVEAGSWSPVYECNDIYGNVPDNFVGDDCGSVIGYNGNFSLDPLFGSVAGCPSELVDFCLSPESPLLPENSPPGCGLVGAKDLCPWTGVAGTGVTRGPLSVLAPSPSPFSQRSTIAFSLPQGCTVDASIYGILGRRVRTLFAGVLPAGSHEVEWDGRGDDGERVASGVYVAVIRAGGREAARTLLFIR